MATWRDVKWTYKNDRVYTQDGKSTVVCVVPASAGSDTDRDSIGRAIAHAWNIDLAAARSWRELFGVEDQLKNRED